MKLLSKLFILFFADGIPERQEVKLVRKLSLILAGFLLIAALDLSVALAIEIPPSEHVKAELISEVSSIKPGESFWLAVRLVMAPGWHTYWQNPGDAGLATRINWKLPEGFEAGDIQWPYPQRIELPPLVNFGYEGEIMLLSEIKSSGKIRLGATVGIGTEADWLECKEICIPGRAELSVFLPVKDEPPKLNGNWAASFSEVRKRIPLQATDWEMKVFRKGTQIIISALPPKWFKGKISNLLFFPVEDNVIEIAEPQEFMAAQDHFTLKLQESSITKGLVLRLKGVLVAPDGWRGRDSEQALWLDQAIEGRR